MKTRFIAVIIIGVIISAGAGYLYDQMYDCLFPPTWMKIPRSYGFGDCLQMYAGGAMADERVMALNLICGMSLLGYYTKQPARM